MRNILFFLLMGTNLIAFYSVYKISERNQAVRSKLDSCKAQAKLVVGDLAASFQAIDLNQNVETLNFVDSDQFTLVQFIKPDCGGCMKQIHDYWPKLNADPGLEHVSRILVSIGSFEETVSKIPEALRIGHFLIADDPAVQRAYGITRVPTTLVISPDGKVDWVFSDLMTEKTYHDILEKIGQ